MESIRQKRTELENELNGQIEHLNLKLDPQQEVFETFEIRPKKTNISVRLLSLVWAPQIVTGADKCSGDRKVACWIGILNSVNSQYFNRKSHRKEDYDYSGPGWYFVTVCTFQSRSIFGDVKNGTMILNSFGRILEEEWCASTRLRKNLNN